MSIANRFTTVRSLSGRMLERGAGANAAFRPPDQVAPR